MIEKKSILLVILARGGSKGVPKKNIKDLAGKPLINYIINAALEASRVASEEFEIEVVLSSDSKDIIDIANNISSGIAPFRRPRHLATDDAESIDAVRDAVERMEKRKKAEYDAVALLQPTAPLTNPNDILECIELLFQTESSFVSVVTIQESPVHPFKMKRRSESGEIYNYIDQGFEDMRPRQLLPKVYKRNGAIYLSKRDIVMKGKK
ncbi:MAG: acylneuraminate cytidylyltransferase family protein, partial [Pseudomonadota bacterium]|nr:acylneuraminate cytidylyltransferase family protein [Pseudomonadota bacterium]